MGEFETDLHARIGSGQRLFALMIEEVRELDPTLDRLELMGHPVYVLEDGRGIIRRATKAAQYPWVSADVLNDAWLAAGGGGGLPSHVVVAVNNAQLIDAAVHDFNSDRSIEAERRGNAKSPIVVVPTGIPWDTAVAGGIELRRLLRQCEEEFERPVVIVADRFWGTAVDGEFGRLLHWITFPPLAPAELFSSVVSVLELTGGRSPEAGDLALEICKRLDPIGRRELAYCMRLATLEHGCVDERVAQTRETERARFFQEIGAVTYFRHGQLPDRYSVGLPDKTRRQIDGWAAARRSLSGGVEGRLPSRILVEGPPGHGRTKTALMLAGVANLSVARLEPARCMMKDVGASERLLSMTLAATSLLHGGLVLLDDIDGFLSAASSVGLGSVRRMEGCLLNWLDRYQRVTVVLTAASLEALPAQWRWRVHMRLSLPDLSLDAASARDRGAVFQAVFHKCGLRTMAADVEFAVWAGDRTNPRALQPRLLPSPAALVRGSGLSGQFVEIESGRDIEWWVQETLLLHAQNGLPDSRPFWEEKLR